MAEGGDLTSIKDGSDAVFEYVCTPCGEDSIREEAFKYCPECQEYLCTTCTRHHGRQKITRSHKLLDRKAAKQASVIAMTTKCHYHPDRDIEMYCGTHDMVYCTKCIATEHRVCSGVTDIEEIRTTSVTQKEIELLQKETRNMQERLQDTDKKTKENIDCLEEQRGDILAKIEKNERDLIEHIQKLNREAKDTMNKEYTVVREELNSNIILIGSMKKAIENASSQLQTFTSMDAGQQFVQMKLIQYCVNDAVKLVNERKPKGRKALCFTENTDFKTSILTATSLGQVNTLTESDRQTTQRIYKVKSRKEINIKMQNNDTNCYIIDVCQLKDGTIILADNSNRKIKRLHINYNIKDHYDIGNCPTGICCTGQNEVAVKMKNKVQFISVGSSMSKLREISVECGGYLGMGYCAGELWISNALGVNVYSTSGTLLKTINQVINGQKIFKPCAQYMAVSGETVIVADQSDGAVCLGSDYTVQSVLRDGRLVHTKGVCVSSDGTVFLSGHNSNNIMMFDKDGKCLVELVGKDAGLKKPMSLHYDDKNNCLIVTCVSSNEVVVFAISS